MKEKFNIADLFVLTQEQIENVSDHCTSLEKTMTEYMEKNPKGTDEWLEARIRRLEEQVKELQDAKRADTHRQRNAEDIV